MSANSSGKNPSLIAMELMKAQAALAAAMSDTVSVIGGTLLQLRSHERGVEGHDDIVLVMKDEVVTVTETAMDWVVDVIESAANVQYTNKPGLESVIDRAIGGDYAGACETVTAKYAPAFSNRLAKRVLADAGKFFVEALDHVARSAVATAAMAGYAKHHAVISNADVWSVVANSIKSIRGRLRGSVDGIVDNADAELDGLAAKENGFFNHLLDEGYDENTAVAIVETRFSGRIRAKLSKAAEANNGEEA